MPNTTNNSSSFADFKTGKLAAVIFDVDGVLVDTESLKYEAWRQALAKLDVQFSVAEYLPLVGHSSVHILDAILENHPIEDLDKKAFIKSKNALYHSVQARGVPLLAPAINFFKALIALKATHAFKIGVASSAAKKEIMENLSQAGIDLSQVDAIVSGGEDLDEFQDAEGTKNKPKPYIYQKTCQLLGIRPAEAFALEDTTAGTTAACTAGLQVIVTPNEYTQAQNFDGACALIPAGNVDLWRALEALLEQSLPKQVSKFKIS